MRSKILVMVVAVLGLMLATAWGADIAGTWKGERPGMGGQPMELSFTFKVNGSEFTGTSSAMGNENPISEGKINGDEISFVVKVDMMGNEMKINYKGKVSGDEMRLTMRMEGGMGGPPGGGPGGGGMGGPPGGGPGGGGMGGPPGGSPGGRGMGGPPELVLNRVK